MRKYQEYSPIYTESNYCIDSRATPNKVNSPYRKPISGSYGILYVFIYIFRCFVRKSFCPVKLFVDCLTIIVPERR